MKKNFILGAALLLASSAIFVASCSKDKDSSEIDATTATPATTVQQGTAITSGTADAVAQDDATSDNLYDDLYSTMEEAVTTSETANYPVSSSTKSTDVNTGTRTVTIDVADSTKFPKTITISFSNWTDPAGRVKNGKVITVVTGKYRAIGSVKTITAEDFTVDSVQLEGTKKVENLGRNADGYLQYKVTLVGGKATFPTGKYITREFTRTRTWIAGERTPKILKDDVYTVEGSASGINRNNVAYSRTIISPLTISAACPWVASGTVELKAGNRVMTITYGDSTSSCDNKATVTHDGKSKIITLPRGKYRDLLN